VVRFASRLIEANAAEEMSCDPRGRVKPRATADTRLGVRAPWCGPMLMSTTAIPTTAHTPAAISDVARLGARSRWGRPGAARHVASVNSDAGSTGAGARSAD
jgi:hypothetical protein